MTTTYEVHTLKDGRWMIAAVHDRKGTALNEARGMTENRFFDGIRVIAESFNETSGDTRTYTVFTHDPERQNRARADRPSHPQRRRRQRPDGYKGDLAFAGGRRPAKKTSLMGHAFTLVLVMSSMTSVLIAMSMFVK